MAYGGRSNKNATEYRLANLQSCEYCTEVQVLIPDPAQGRDHCRGVVRAWQVIAAGSEFFYCLDQFADHGLPVPIEHAGVITEEQCILDTGEALALSTLDDDDILRLVGIEDGHAVDRAVGVGARRRG